METAVDIFTGFLDSGKTSLIIDAVEHSDFDEYRQTVLILCERRRRSVRFGASEKGKYHSACVEEEATV